MTQRNPMNERSQSELKGQTKKSAASLKPKTKAASSVHVKSTKKTPKQNRENRKAERQRQAELERLYYNPPTREYKRLRRIWIALISVGLIATAVGGLLTAKFDNAQLSWAFIIPAYACIIAAVWLDLGKIRKLRRAYQADMVRKHGKKPDAAIAAAQAAEAQAKQDRKPLFARRRATEADKPDAAADAKASEK